MTAMPAVVATTHVCLAKLIGDSTSELVSTLEICVHTKFSPTLNNVIFMNKFRTLSDQADQESWSAWSDRVRNSSLTPAEPQSWSRTEVLLV